MGWEGLAVPISFLRIDNLKGFLRIGNLTGESGSQEGEGLPLGFLRRNLPSDELPSSTTPTPPFCYHKVNVCIYLKFRGPLVLCALRAVRPRDQRNNALYSEQTLVLVDLVH